MKAQDLSKMMVPPESLRGARTRRRSPWVHETVKPGLVQTYLEDGWEVERENKNTTRMRRPKKADVAFEDAVWTLFADMGFDQLNVDRKFVLKYGKDDASSRQVDVFAADDETALIVECKSAVDGPSTGSFKPAIESLVGIKEGLIRSTRKALPHRKVKILFATRDYLLTERDLARIKDAGFVHFDDRALEYYQELTKHLGAAARFQLLGRLFAGTKIEGMDNRIPAIQGQMGGHKYFAFSIEPEKLLKIGYVLHRSEANADLMPTYQRIIKKSRLKAVRDFIQAGNFFPNSVIINIDAKRSPQFDRAQINLKGTKSRVGVLHLPQLYRSAYIIDGQHRLYGFAGTPLSRTETIPVVAFVDLSPTEQVKLFMDINENQKAVPKNLQNTLNATILWDSDDKRQASRALKLQLAQSLGDRPDSPLAGRIIIGENIATRQRCITIQAIKTGFDRGSLFGQFTATKMTSSGTLYAGTNLGTLNIALPFLESFFKYLRDELPEQWDLGNAELGVVFTNTGIQSVLRLLSDVLDHLVTVDEVNALDTPADDLTEFVAIYFDPALKFLHGLTPVKIRELKKRYGSGGYVPFWRQLQRAVHEEFAEFDPPDMLEWFEEQSRDRIEASSNIVRRLEEFMNDDFRTRLQDAYGDSWFKDGLPIKVYKDAINAAAEENYAQEQDVHPWSQLYLIQYREIACKSDEQWIQLFKDQYKLPGSTNQGGRKAQTRWMEDLNLIRRELAHPPSHVTKDEFDFLLSLRDWFLED